MMSRRLVLMAAAILLPFAGTGCGAAILAYQDRIALDYLPSYAPGSSREEVEARLGKAETARALPDGSRVSTYTYTIRNPEWRNMKWQWALGTVITAGFAEGAWVPWAAYEVVKHRRAATFTYDANDRLVSHGPPPAYGPPDDAVGSLSLNGIRERCRSETSGDLRDRPGGVTGGPPTAPRDLYDECLVGRLAIWGIE